MQYVGMDHLYWSNGVWLKTAEIELDFNAPAKGSGIDEWTYFRKQRLR